MLFVKEINLLQAQNEGLKKQNAELQKENAELKAENDRLKEKIIKLSEEKGHLIVKNNTLEETNQSLSLLGTTFASANEIVRKEFFRADKNKDMWREKAENLQKTLQEIKKIALLGTNVYKEEKEPDSLSTWKNAQFEKILNLITKSESEEE